MTELPKLPKASRLPCHGVLTVGGHTDNAMRAYGAECYRKGIEDAAIKCEALGEASKWADWHACAANIRGMT